MAKTRAMKVTTVRFSEDLWGALSREAALAGVSASQFIREAALARASAAAGARGELPFGSFSSTADEIAATVSPGALQRHDVQEALGLLTQAIAGDVRTDAEALRAQSRQSKRKAEQIQRRAHGDGITRST